MRKGFTLIHTGFTLIELLIAIAILGILTGSVVTLINPQKKLGQARDARRKTDLAEIRRALEMYYISNGNKYPEPSATCHYGENCYVHSTNAQPWIPALVTSKILEASVPVDPKNSGGYPWGAGGYTYSYGNVTADGQNFDLIGQLENTADSERCELKNYRSPIIGSWCGSYSKQIYERSPLNNN